MPAGPGEGGSVTRYLQIPHRPGSVEVGLGDGVKGGGREVGTVPGKTVMELGGGGKTGSVALSSFQPSPLTPPWYLGAQASQDPSLRGTLPTSSFPVFSTPSLFVLCVSFHPISWSTYLIGRWSNFQR